MIYLDTVDPFAKIADPTVADTYSKILADLLIADKIGSTNSLQQEKLLKAAVFALLSRVYLYLGNDPASVITYGNLAIAGNPVCPRANMTNLWKDANSSGVLFKLRIDQVDGVTQVLFIFKL
jgi:hypothetical protein